MSADRPPAEPPTALGYVALLRENHNFRHLWAGQIISLLGDWFNVIATMTLIADLTGSGMAIGTLFAIRMLAPFLVSPLAGLAADRFDRRTILIVSDVVRCVTVLGFLLVDDPSEVWLLYALTFVQLALTGFFFPARNALLGDIVRPIDIGAANTLSSATWSTMLALGAAAGGFVAGAFGVRVAFVIDAATFLLSAAVLARIRPPVTERAALEGGLRGPLNAYVEGLRYLRTHLDILVIALNKSANALIVAAPFQVVQVALAQRHGTGAGVATALGLIMTFVGIGTGVGPILARALTGDRDRALRRAISASYLCSAAGLLTLGWGQPFWLVLAGSVLRGVGGGVGWVFSTQLLLHRTPEHVRGRVFSTEFALLTLMSAIGASLGGAALDGTDLGISGVSSWMAALVVLPAVLWTLWNRHLARTRV